MAGAVCKCASIPSFSCAPSLAPLDTLSPQSPSSSFLSATRRRGSRVTQKERRSQVLCNAECEEQAGVSRDCVTNQNLLPRRHALAALSATAVAATLQNRAEAVQGMVAGRLPGLGPEDADGFRKYTRPEGKSGGHGVGWTEFDPYSFRIPEGWEEVPVSIADLGGTEIDLRFSNPAQGNISVVVAPVLRFADLGENPTIDMIGSPDKVINAFGPEVIGQVVDDKVVYARSETKEDRRLYYQFELNGPHVLITATAASNRLYLFNVSATTRQWKKSEATLRKIADSFRVAKRAPR
ncbi:psbP family protein [Klebsormidium nitens]|uniref:PsbP family protein n=1 Tax=Klebsormidium nitens TaxID=105231 RepID=A0A1Y1HZR6_KLENI|nr:psbP family protein [Klebsormidium nitens]|eukprot:GAQ83222.1 psbP family protein [Klebsormidium nitens]